MQVGYAKNAILDEYLASLHTALQCYQLYESQSVKNKATTKRRAEHSPRRPSLVQGDNEVSVRGLTLYAGDEGRSNLPGHNPLGHNPVFCCRKTS